ncbi:uncharacterized protein KGF55_005735 [Candida pseudojiufengensis]|uniref:uncharacterized protein n=1 Tax=Candida pseudojiufengensis TaxID=497109 RepID=UPI002224D1B4|nr:uncharacterized protein KGF55_005735 [Candida pseudojiufengensis]KAI5958736.1 hypothetical protein KGF55_005735 [Candida pseudojiufengensis]
MTSSDESTRKSISDESHRSLQQSENYEIYPITSRQTHQSHQSIHTNSSKKTTYSELSKIISGIKDDQIQSNKDYVERGDAEFLMAKEIDRAASRNISRASIDQEHSIVEDEDEEDDEKEHHTKELDDDYPTDGAFAWVMAFCSMLGVFSTWGANAGYGVFLNYYLNSNTFPEATEYDFALIGGIVVFCANFFSPVSAFLYKIMGFKYVCGLGIIFQTLGWIAASFATRVWHLYLSQGVAVGISFSLIFIPATLVLPTWFVKQRAGSMGLCVSGAGLGGLIFSLSVNKVIQDTGDQRWALRMVGFVTLFASSVCALMMRPRNSKNIAPIKERLTSVYMKDTVGVIFDIKVFKNWGICVVSVWFAIALIGYTLMLFSLSSYASAIGLTHQQGSVLTAVMNAAQIIGRPSMGLTADKYGRANFTSVCCLVICIFLYAFWINAKTFGSLIAFAVIIGFIIGIGSSLAQPLAADSLEGQLEKLPAGWSGINIFVSFFCLVSEVIALSLVNNKLSNPYLHTQIFAGTCFFACFLLVMVLREYLVRKVITNRYEEAKSKLDKLGGVTKSGYLKIEDEKTVEEAEETEEILNERIERYEHLLRFNIVGYFMRLVYPIRV